MENIKFRKASAEDFEQSWAAISYAKRTMLEKGRHQWTEAYPSPDNITADIAHGSAYVLEVSGQVAVYASVSLNGEPEYCNLKEGKWLTDGDYYVIHRLAVAEHFRGKGLAKRFFDYVAQMCITNGVKSIKADTNYDNAEMLHILQTLGFEHCGRIDYEVSGTRLAFEKTVS